jgi:hypothetical protein
LAYLEAKGEKRIPFGNDKQKATANANAGVSPLRDGR